MREPRVVRLRTREARGAVRVDRATKWGNHEFIIGRDGDRVEVINKFLNMVLLPPNSVHIKELRGQDLACWCAPEPCHADVLLRIANADPDCSFCKGKGVWRFIKPGSVPPAYAYSLCPTRCWRKALPSLPVRWYDGD